MITVEEVKSKTPERFWSKVRFGGIDECWEWQNAIHEGGYGVFSLILGVRWTTIKAHRYCYQKLNGEMPKDILALHKCDNRKCVNPNHLFAGTQKDNMQDMLRKGRNGNKVFRGSANGNSKITEEDVLRIRKKLADGIGHKEISEVFGVSKALITHINTGRIWSHISNN